MLVASWWVHSREKGGMVGLAGFEPAISWVPGATAHSLPSHADCPDASRIMLSSRPGYPTAPRSPPKCDVALALTFRNQHLDSFVSNKKVSRSYLSDLDSCVVRGRVNQSSMLVMARGRHASFIPVPLYHIFNKRRDSGKDTRLE